jgi:hypothetical protein
MLKYASHKRFNENTNKKTLCNSVNLRVTLCNDFFTQSYTENHREPQRKNLCTSVEEIR